MKRIPALLAAGVLVLGVSSAAFAADEVFTADLSGGAQVPPLAVDGTGDATVTIADDESSISWVVTYSGLTGDPAAGHIHFGAVDATGPVMIPFATVTPTGSTGTFAAADYVTGAGLPADWAGVLAAVRDGNAYVNIHTAANPPGEIRGQLSASAAPATDTVVGTATPEAPAPLGILLLAAVFGLAIGMRRFVFR